MPSKRQVSEPDWESQITEPRLSPPPRVFGTIRKYAARLKHIPAPRILVVDDEPGVRTFVERVLRNAGYQVVTVDGGGRALDIIQGGAGFELIVCDVRMPGMSGPEFVDGVRRQRPGIPIPVLYLTGYSDQLFKERIALTESEAFLNKPSTVKGLLEAVSLRLCGHLLPTQPFYVRP
jgi:two-component system cell cycle sensor histidine kinase/response regulator CckA